MHKKSIRSITWLVLAAMLVSLLALPAMAAAENAEDGAAEEELFDETAMPIEDDEAPLVNVIDDEPADEPAPAEEPAPADEPDPAEEPAPADEPDPAEEPADPDASSEELDPDAGEEASEEMEVDGAGEKFTVSYYNGTELLSTEEVVSGEKPANAPTDDGAGRAIKAWLDGSGKQVVPADTAVTADVSFYAWFAPRLNTVTHDSYINGTGSAKFGPTASLTRAQAATILYKLLESQNAGPFNTAFSDVSDSAWYAAAVKTLASIGGINGYTDGTFRPNRNVTRAEFVTMLVNLTGATGSDISFSDVSETHWARNAIAAAAENGWVTGYTDGTFRPGNNITRAEAVVIMNRVLGRSADRDAVDHGSGLFHFIDVSTGAWYYYDVMEAATGHQFTKSGDTEAWTAYNKEKSDLAPGLHQIGGVYVFVDSNSQPVYMKAGINLVDGKFFYAASAGYSFIGDLSSKAGYAVFSNGAADQALSDGFNMIGTTLFYWSLADASAMKMNATLNKIGNRSFWADEDGYNIRNDFDKGVVNLGGKNYLSSGNCAIITSGVAHSKPTSKPTTIDLKKHTFEYSGKMYYLKDDYSLATDEWIGLLYFGADCAYTSGDATLDGYVYNVIKSFVDNNALTQVQKLLKAYYYIRGGEGANYVDSPFGYTRINQIMIQYGRFNRQAHIPALISSAKSMFTTKRGMCYQWAAIYLYMARRLGFQAYPVVGDMNGARHCWDLILWGGVWHLSDVEFEWGYMSGWYGPGYQVYRNLFDQDLSKEWVPSFTNSAAGLTYTFPSKYDKYPTVYS